MQPPKPEVTITNSNGNSRVRILLAEDHQILRNGLRALLERESDFDIVGEAPNGRLAVEMATNLKPDVIVMDISMPELNGIDATRQLANLGSMPRVVALSQFTDHRFVAEMLRAGAKAYVLKESAFDQLAAAVRDVVAGRLYLDPRITGGVVDEYLSGAKTAATLAPFATLSPREREVLQLLAEGRATKEIARDLDLSVKTVETHRRQLMEKLQLYSVAELTKYAIREGLSTLA